jgi:hypothetical protein
MYSLIQYDIPSTQKITVWAQVDYCNKNMSTVSITLLSD